MKELSLNILDVAKNSVTAGATRIEITVAETPERLTITITDNGCGMTPEFVTSERYCSTDPWYSPWQPNASGSAVLAEMLLNYFGGKKA